MSDTKASQIGDRIERLNREAQELKKQIRSTPAVLIPDPEEVEEAVDTEKEKKGLDVKAGNESPVPERTARPTPPRPVSAGSRQDLEGDYRLANYMSTKGFMPKRSVRHSRSVQRNKALVMLTLVAIVAYMLYKVMF